MHTPTYGGAISFRTRAVRRFRSLLRASASLAVATFTFLATISLHAPASGAQTVVESQTADVDATASNAEAEGTEQSLNPNANLLFRPDETSDITGTILVDTDHDGVFEESLAPIEVRLIDTATNSPLATTTLDLSTDHYRFTNVNNGNVTIEPDLDALGVYPVVEADDTPDGRINLTASSPTSIGGQDFFVAPQSLNPDTSIDNPIGTPVTLDPLANDHYPGTPTALALHTDTIAPSTNLAIPNEGTWIVDQDTFDVTFTPIPTFRGTTTPISYTIDLPNNITAPAATTSTIAVSYIVPNATDVDNPDNIPGQSVTVSPLGGAAQLWDPASLKVIDQDGSPVASASVPTVGTWQVNAADGTISFTPDALIDSKTTTSVTIDYEVTTPGCSVDADCHTSTGTVTIDYIEALDAAEMDLRPLTGYQDIDLGPVYSADYSLDLSTIRLVHPTSGERVTEVAVTGEGTWKLDPQQTSSVRFTPEPGTHVDATPIGFLATDVYGTAKYYGTIESPAAPTFAAPPSTAPRPAEPSDSAWHYMATIVEGWDEFSFAFFDPVTNEAVEELVVPGEGTWKSYFFDTPSVGFFPEVGFFDEPSPAVFALESIDDGLIHYSSAVLGYTDSTEPTHITRAVPGTTVTFDPLAHDDGTLDPTTVKLVHDKSREGSTTLDDYYGTWTADPATGHITYTPREGAAEDRFVSGAAEFQVEPVGCSDDPNCEALVTPVSVSYMTPLAPLAMDAHSIGAPATTMLSSGVHKGIYTFNFKADTLKLVHPVTGERTTEVVVDGEGTWRLGVPQAGMIRFEPESGVHADPTPIGIDVDSDNDNLVSSHRSGFYTTVASPAAPTFEIPPSLNNIPGSAVTIPRSAFAASPLANASVTYGINALTLDGAHQADDGTWVFDGGGNLTFTPRPGLSGDPQPRGIHLRRQSGPYDVSNALVTISYAATWISPVSVDKTPGTTVSIDPLANDDGTLDPASLTLIDLDTKQPVTQVSDSQGTWTLDQATGFVVFTPHVGSTDNPKPVTVSATDDSTIDPQTYYSTVAVDYGNLTEAPSAPNNLTGSTVTVDTLINGLGILDPASLRLTDPTSNQLVTTLTVPGEGTWTVGPVHGTVTFAPEAGFTEDPTPVDYTFASLDGAFTRSGTAAIDYITVLSTPPSTDNPPLGPASVDPLATDNNTLDPSSVKLLRPSDSFSTTSLLISGEGTWSVDATTGVITFAPAAGFTGDPAPVDYTIRNLNDDGLNHSSATIDYSDMLDPITVEPELPNTTATFNPLANHNTTFDPASLKLWNPATKQFVTSINVPSVGTWTVNDTTGATTFDPSGLWYSDADRIPSIHYQVDVAGCTDPSDCPKRVGIMRAPYPVDVGSTDFLNRLPGTIKIGRMRQAADWKYFVDGSFRFVDPASGDLVSELVVEGEGVWTSDVPNKSEPSDGLASFEAAPGFDTDASPVRFVFRQADPPRNYFGTLESSLAPMVDMPAFDNMVPGTPVSVPGSAFKAAQPAMDTTRAKVHPAEPDRWRDTPDGVVTSQGTWNRSSNSQDPNEVIFTPYGDASADPEPFFIRIYGSPTVWAEINVSYAPTWASPANAPNDTGTVATIDPFINEPQLDPTTAQFYDYESQTHVTTLTTPDEGTWTTNPTSGEVSFTPTTGFEDDPTPVLLAAFDRAPNGPQIYYSQTTVLYANRIETLVSRNNAPDSPATIDPRSRSRYDLDPTSVEFFNPRTGTKSPTITVSGEGTWTSDPTSGLIIFTPEAGFVDDPTPIGYTVGNLDNDGVNQSTAAADYANVLITPAAIGGAPGTAITIGSIAGNSNALDQTTVQLYDHESQTHVDTLTTAGEGTWSLHPVSRLITFTPSADFVDDPTPVNYRIDDLNGDANYATATIHYASLVDPTTVTNAVAGSIVTIDPFADDDGTLDPTSVTFIDPATRESVTSLTVPGEGTWTVDPTSGAITFTPRAAFITFTAANGFTNDPTPVTYRIGNLNGNGARYPTARIHYANLLNTPASGLHIPGTPATVDPLANTNSSFDPASVRLIDPVTGSESSTLTVANEGTWAIDPTSGAITFTPDPGFTADPTPVDFSVGDLNNGGTSQSTVAIDYADMLNTPAATGTAPGRSVTIAPLADYEGTLDPTSVRLVNLTTGITSLTLTTPGEGTWTASPTTGTITFTPEPGFTSDPTPIGFTIDNLTDDRVNYSTAAIDYATPLDKPVVSGAVPGRPATINPLADGEGTLDPASVRLLNPATGQPTTTLAVAGEGTWTIDPTSGVITFTPEPGFTTDPTPIGFTIDDLNDGSVTYSSGAIDYATLIEALTVTGVVPGSVVTIDPLAGNREIFDPTSVRLIDPDAGHSATTITVPGEGTWTSNPTTGLITFTPARVSTSNLTASLVAFTKQSGFASDPSPIGFTIDNLNDDGVNYSTAAVDYATPLNTPAVTGATPGTPVTIDPRTDDGTLDPTSVRLVNPATGVKSLTLTTPGEGTWTVNPTTGTITFTPEPGFTSDPTPVDFTVGNLADDDVSAGTAAIGYTGTANDNPINDNPLNDDAAATASPAAGDDAPVGQLAFTGSSPAPLTLVALFLMLLGVSLTALGNRRRHVS